MYHCSGIYPHFYEYNPLSKGIALRNTNIPKESSPFISIQLNSFVSNQQEIPSAHISDNTSNDDNSRYNSFSELDNTPLFQNEISWNDDYETDRDLKFDAAGLPNFESRSVYTQSPLVNKLQVLERETSSTYSLDSVYNSCNSFSGLDSESLFHNRRSWNADYSGTSISTQIPAVNSSPQQKSSTEKRTLLKTLEKLKSITDSELLERQEARAKRENLTCERIELDLAKKELDRKKERRIGSLAMRQQEKVNFHKKWVDQHKADLQTPRSERNLGLLAEAERRLKDRLKEKESDLKEKWGFLLHNINQKLKEGPPNQSGCYRDLETDPIVVDLSSRRIWSIDATTLEDRTSKLLQKETAVIAAIQAVEAARLQRENVWIMNNIYRFNLSLNEINVAAFRSRFRHSYPPILFVAQLPLEQQILLGAATDCP